MKFCVTIVDIEDLCHHSGIGMEPLVIHCDGDILNFLFIPFLLSPLSYFTQSIRNNA